MALDPSIILAGRQANILGAMEQGNALARQTGQLQTENALRQVYSQHGPGIARGEANALNALAAYDPMAAFDISTGIEDRTYRRQRDARTDDRQARMDERQVKLDDRADQKWQMELAQYAATLSQQEREAQAAQVESAVKMGLAAQSPQEWDALVAQSGAPDLMGQFGNREALAQKYMTVAEILKRGDGAQFRPASAEEAGQYGAAAGQFGPDGRFYPVNPPSGMSIETGPDGQLRVVQGPGAVSGAKLTETQSKDVGFSTRARAALETLEPIAETMTSRAQGALDAVPWGLGRDFQNPEYQVAQNAATNFLLAILRKDTGAAVTPSEEKMYSRVFLPMPGDGPELLAQKSRARELAIAGLEAGMPPAAILAQGEALLAADNATPSQQPAPAPAQPAAAPSGSDEDLLRKYGIQ